LLHFIALHCVGSLGGVLGLHLSYNAIDTIRRGVSGLSAHNSDPAVTIKYHHVSIGIRSELSENLGQGTFRLASVGESSWFLLPFGQWLVWYEDIWNMKYLKRRG
jgi:hypothetical protein